MASSEEPPHRERDQTDESLRVERHNADEAIGHTPTAIEEMATAVIEKARERADRLLARSRTTTDRQLPRGISGIEPRQLLAQERAREDATLHEERRDADAVLEAERALNASVLEAEREETDKNLSHERERADAAVSIRDELLGVVSHDLRNMLHAVMGFGALIGKAEVEPDHQERVLLYSQRIHRAGMRMNRLIGDLVDLASIEAGSLAVHREVGDPSHVIDEVIDTFKTAAAEQGLALESEVARGLPSCDFDAARLLQVLVNLVTNAIKFTPAGGRIVVRLELVEEDLRFSVADTGKGIPADQLVAVFERYRQVTPNDRRGVGLGLYIAQCIVQGHGGKIWVESGVTKGSTFYFSIPASPPKSS